MCFSIYASMEKYDEVESLNSSGSISTSSEGRNGLPLLPYSASHLPRELVVCIMLFLFGMFSPGMIFRPLIGINMRPIPYQRLSTGDVVLDLGLNNPLVEEVTVPSALLLHSSITLPLIVLIATTIISPRTKSTSRIHETHAAVCTLFATIGMSEFVTQMVKMYVGRLRPNFYALCQFDPITLQCAASKAYEMEGRQSFPSGHSSLSMAGMGVLAFFFLGRANIGWNDQERPRISNQYFRSCWTSKTNGFICLMPLAYATFVASSRLVDNWHHPSDIVAGICIGLFCSIFCYHLWYPSVLSSLSGTPLSVEMANYFHAEKEGAKNYA